MRQCMDADNLHRRLKKIIGQVQAIDRMVDEDVPCEDMLAQINAAKSALHKAGQIVLEGHIRGGRTVREYGVAHGAKPCAGQRSGDASANKPKIFLSEGYCLPPNSIRSGSRLTDSFVL